MKVLELKSKFNPEAILGIAAEAVGQEDVENLIVIIRRKDGIVELNWTYEEPLIVLGLLDFAKDMTRRRIRD